MRDTSIRERRGGSSAQALSLQHLELGPHSLQNREMQPAPPGPQARAHRDSPGRSSRTHALSAVLLRGGDPPGGRAGWREGGRQCPECPWMPLRSTQRPLRRGVRTVSVPDRSRRWGQAQLARPPPRLAPGGTVPPMSPPSKSRPRAGCPRRRCWCPSSVASEVDPCASPQGASGPENEPGAASTPPLALRPLPLASGHRLGPARVSPHPGHGVAPPGLRFPLGACPGWTWRPAGSGRLPSAAPPCSAVRLSLRNGPAPGWVRATQNAAAITDVDAASNVTS